jgi:hypothetical protein
LRLRFWVGRGDVIWVFEYVYQTGFVGLMRGVLWGFEKQFMGRAVLAELLIVTTGHFQ